ncbi:MAG: hypothetical protein JW730_07000 [Anaerolineales bacterium]|nr:hypothetical protein [Anaerolineales bacterium]
MENFFAIFTERLIWITNGFLATVYSLADHLNALAFAVAIIAFVATTAREQRSWAAGAGILSMVASLLAPSPVPLFLLVMIGGGWAAVGLERYNRPAQRWNVIRGLALYALSGLGFTLYRNMGLGESVLADPMMANGAGYLNAIIGIAMYVIPLGYLAMVAQAVWAHPPAIGNPGDLITKVRTRGGG